MAEVTYERRGAAAVLTIDRPERRNAVDPNTADQLLEAYRGFEADDDARVMILTGAGEEAFCAGADLKSVAAAATDQSIAEQWLKPRPRWRVEADCFINCLSHPHSQLRILSLLAAPLGPI